MLGGRLFINRCTPPIAGDLYNRLIKRSGYFGNYSGWEQACHDSTGYDSNLILDRVRDSLLKVKNGEAVYERDSILFDEIQYSWPLLACLLWIASSNGNRLNLLDFGGSLGSSYFQNRALLDHLDELSWNVVEQESFVRCGRQLFENQLLKFYFSIDECLNVQDPEVILLSSVLPYLEHPCETLERIISQKFAYIVIDRTPVLEGTRDRLTVQQVPAEIYNARYPAWILGKDKLLNMFKKDYELVMHFDALAGTILLGDTFAYDKGFIFSRKVYSQI